jgi:hypothetical protein
MKAKMPNKPAEAATYSCNKCSAQFKFEQGALTCPKCKNTNKNEMVVISMKDNPEESQLYTDDDFPGG